MSTIKTPPTGLSSEELRAWIDQNIAGDSMGFGDDGGVEGVPESEQAACEKMSAPMMLSRSSIGIIPFLSTVNYTRASRTKANIRRLVIHYTGNKGDTAKSNCAYYHDAYRGASAGYFVDDASTYQCVEDKNIAWHCGTSGKYYNACRNSNSIGIEMCTKWNGSDYYISEATVARTIKLAEMLMLQYDIPIANVCRHYDVTHKICPRPFVNDAALWADFIARLSTAVSIGQLVASVSGKLGLTSADTWEAILKGETTASAGYVQALLGKVCAAKGKAYSIGSAALILGLTSPDYWMQVVAGSKTATAATMTALFKKINTAI